MKIHVAEPLVFRLNQSATSDTKTVFEYLFSSLYPQLRHSQVSEEHMKNSYEHFDLYVENFYKNKCLEKLEQDREKDKKIAEKDSTIAEDKAKIAELENQISKFKG
jgi:hypothetical protein